MTYAAKDKSKDDGEPVYFYKVHSLSFTQIYKYCRAEKDLDLSAANTYLGRNIKHSEIPTTSILDSPQTVDITLPADDPLAKRCCGQKLPKDVFVTIYRKHRNDNEFKVEWLGTMIGAGASGNESWIKTGSIIQNKLNGFCRMPQMQRHCNNDYCDELCGLDEADYTTTVTVAEARQRYIEISSSGATIGMLMRGKAKNVRTGETHPILWHSTGDVAAEQIGVGYPFDDIVPGDELEVTEGCDYLRLGNCLAQGNTDHFNGMDLAPLGDIFATLNTNTAITTTESVTTSTTETVAEEPEPEVTWPSQSFVYV